MSEATPTTPTLVERLIAAKADIGAVGKGEFNKQQGWNFRGIDAVINACSGPLNRHGVFTYPSQILNVREGTATTAKGAVMNTVTVQMQYAFTAGGETIYFQAPGTAFDSGDKAMAKAMSVAYRTALIPALQLPTDEPDPDLSVYEAAPEQRLDDDTLMEKIATIDSRALLVELWNEQGGGRRSQRVEEAFSKRAATLRPEDQK